MGIPSSIVNGIADFFNNIITLLGKLLNYFNPTSEDFILKIIIDGIVDIGEFILNFFTNLLDFVLHIFIPTDSQWEEIKESYSNLRITIEEHIPFWSFVKSTITEAQETNIIPSDFLVIKMPSFNFYGGKTEEKEYIDVLEAYEPYRVQVRGLLLLVVYACAFVYIIKLITDYKANVGGSVGVDNLKAGNRLND